MRVLLGAGGHGRAVLDAAGLGVIEGILDRDRTLWGTRILGVAVLGGDALLHVHGYFIMGLGGVRDNGPRQRLFEWASTVAKPLSVIHPYSVLARYSRVGEGTVVLAGAVVAVGAQLGVNVIVNTGAIVEHDCLIGDHVHVASGACVTAGVRIGAGAHIGAGSVIRQGLTIGARAVVGAGAVVVKDVPQDAVVVGVPARPLSAPLSTAAKGSSNA